MGCCQTRDENPKGQNRPKNRTKSLSVDLRLSLLSQDDLLPSTSMNSNDLNESLENNEKSLLLYLQGLSSKKKWEQLAPLIVNLTEVQEPNIYISWTEKPQSVGCVALVHLAIGLKKYTVQVSPYIEIFLSVICSFLKSGSMDLKENSVFLLYYFAEFASERALKKLMELNLFGAIVKFLVSTKKEMRKLTANLCYKLYKDRKKVKAEFVKANGGFYLIQLIGWYGDNEFLEELLRNLKELLRQDEVLIEENINATVNPFTLKILTSIDTSTRNLEVVNELEELIMLYKGNDMDGE